MCVHVAERSPLGHLLKHWEGSRVVLEALEQQEAVEILRVQRVVVARALGWLVVGVVAIRHAEQRVRTVKTKGTAVRRAKSRQEQEPTPRRAGEQSPNTHIHL